jgi:hypothetical protein
MFSRVQQNQHYSAAQRPIGRNYRRVRKALPVLEPLSGVALSVFIAGILVPSFLRSGMATHHGLAVGSLHTLTIGGVKLSYTLENLSFAILGAMFGSLIALAIEFPATFAKTTRNFLMFRQVDWNKVVEWADHQLRGANMTYLKDPPKKVDQGLLLVGVLAIVAVVVLLFAQLWD